MLRYYSHIKKNMKKTQDVAPESLKFHDVTPSVTLTCQKSVLWVRATASKQHLRSLLHKIMRNKVFLDNNYLFIY